MSSIDEFLVRDFIESEPPPAPASTPSTQDHACLILEGILGSSTDAEMAVLDKALKYVGETGDARKRDSMKKRLMMMLMRDGYDASLCRSSWVATCDCPGGDYEYIVVVMADDGDDRDGGGSKRRLIVDIDFRSQFELARPTSAYAKLSDALPSIFVGDDEKLKKVVTLLCSAAQRSLKESGLHVPPWRKSKYVQSKWLPCFHKASTIALAFPVSARALGPSLSLL